MAETSNDSVQQQYEQLYDTFVDAYGEIVLQDLFQSQGLVDSNDIDGRIVAMENYLDMYPVEDDAGGSTLGVESSSDTDGLLPDINTGANGQNYQTWTGSFNGNDIFYDERATEEVVGNIKKLEQDTQDFLAEVNDIDKFFDGVVYPYSKLIPNPRFKHNELSENLSTSYSNCLSLTNEIACAIKDYSDGGDIDPNATNTLKRWLYGSGSGNGSDDGSGGGSDGGFDGDSSLEPDIGDSIEDEIPELGDSVIGDDNSFLDDSSLGEDEKLIIPGSNGSVLSGSVLGGMIGDTSLDDLSDLSEDNSLGKFGTSSFGDINNSKFFVPSPNTSMASTDGIRGAGVIGGASVVAAASLAVGGKVYYDKRHADDGSEDEDNVSLESDEANKEADLINEIQKETESDEANISVGEIDFDKTGVKFKESLFNDSEVDE